MPSLGTYDIREVTVGIGGAGVIVAEGFLMGGEQFADEKFGLNELSEIEQDGHELVIHALGVRMV